MIFEETAHVKPCPPSLKKLISSPLISSDKYRHLKTRSFKEKFGITALFFPEISHLTLWRVKRKLLGFLKELNRSTEEMEVIKSLELNKFLLSIMLNFPTFIMSFLPFYLFGRIIVKLLESYTSVTLPKSILMMRNYDNIFVQDISSTEERRLSDINLVGRQYYSSVGSSYPKNSSTQIRFLETKRCPSRRSRINIFRPKCRIEDTVKGDIMYKLENGKVNIYSLAKGKISETWLGSLQTTEKVTVFNASYDGATIVTGGKDGIRKWKEIYTPEQIRDLKRQKEDAVTGGIWE